MPLVESKLVDGRGGGGDTLPPMALNMLCVSSKTCSNLTAWLLPSVSSGACSWSASTCDMSLHLMHSDGVTGAERAEKGGNVTP